MDLYLEKIVPVVSKVVVDEGKLASDMVALLNDGCPADYDVACIETGGELSKSHITAIAQSNQGVECSALAGRIYDEIVAESSALKAMRPTEHKTQVAFLDALVAREKHLSGNTALVKLKAYEEVTTWTALKALYPTPVISVIEEKK